MQLEMNELKERLEIEKQGWIENYMKKQVGYFKDRTQIYSFGFGAIGYIIEFLET